MSVYSFNRIRRIRSSVTTETTDALNILKREFDGIRKVLLLEKAKLEKSRKTKKLTKAETKIKKEVAEVDDIVE